MTGENPVFCLHKYLWVPEISSNVAYIVIWNESKKEGKDQESIQSSTTSESKLKLVSKS